MTIASEITRIKTNIDNAYTALEAKGATIPEAKNSANLADTINTITSGSGEANYLGRIVTEDGVLQLPTESFSFSLPDNVTSIGARSLQYMFADCHQLTSVDLSNLTTVGEGGLYMAFAGTGLQSLNLSNLTTVDGAGLASTFSRCSNLTSVDLGSLTTVGQNGLQYAFDYCSNLTSVDLSSLTTVGQGGLTHVFRNTKLTSLSFPALKSDSFGGYTNQFSGMLSSVTDCTVHFPWNLKSVIGQWADVLNGFSGTNTLILYDLNPIPCTITVSPQEGTELYVNGTLKSLSEMPISIVPNNNSICVYNPEYPIYTTTISASDEETSTSISIDLTTLVKRTLTLNTSLDDCNCTFKIEDVVFTPKSSTTNSYSIDVAEGTVITYTVEKAGYLPIVDTITMTGEDKSINIAMVQPFDYSIAYPFTDTSYFDLTNLIGDTKFVVNKKKEELGIVDYNDSCYGYVKITVPASAILEVSYDISINYWTYVALYLGTQEYKPTFDNIEDNITDGTGEYMCRVHSRTSPKDVVTAELEPNKTYFLNCMYVPDSGTPNNWFGISQIRVKSIGSPATT